MKKNVSTHNVWAKAKKTNLHYKLYKDGKHWVSASLFMLSVGAFLFGASGQARADTSADANPATSSSTILNKGSTGTAVTSSVADAAKPTIAAAEDETQTDSYQFGRDLATYDITAQWVGGSKFDPKNLDQISTLFTGMAKYIADPTDANKVIVPGSTYDNDYSQKDGAQLYEDDSGLSSHTKYSFSKGLGNKALGTFNKAQFNDGYEAVLTSWYKQLKGYYDQVDAQAGKNSQALSNYTPYNPSDHDPAQSGIAGVIKQITGTFGKAFSIGADQIAQWLGYTTSLTSDSATKVIFNYSSNSTLTDASAKKAVDTAVNQTVGNINSFINVVVPTVQNVIQYNAYHAVQSLGLKQGSSDSPFQGDNSVSLPATLKEAVSQNSSLNDLAGTVGLSSALNSTAAESVYESLAKAIKSQIVSDAEKGMDESMNNILDNGKFDPTSTFSSIKGFDANNPATAMAEQRQGNKTTSLLAESEGYAFGNKYGTAVTSQAAKDALNHAVNGDLSTAQVPNDVLGTLNKDGVISDADYKSLTTDPAADATYKPTNHGAVNYITQLYTAEFNAVKKAYNDFETNPAKIGTTPTWTNPSTGTKYTLDDYTQVWHFLAKTSAGADGIANADNAAHKANVASGDATTHHITDGKKFDADNNGTGWESDLKSAQLNQTVATGTKGSQAIQKSLPVVYKNVYNNEVDRANQAFTAGQTELIRQFNSSKFQQLGQLSGPNDSGDPNGLSGTNDGTAQIYDGDGQPSGQAFTDGFNSAKKSIVKVSVKTASSDSKFPGTDPKAVYGLLDSSHSSFNVFAPTVAGWGATRASQTITNGNTMTYDPDGQRSTSVTFNYTKNSKNVQNLAVTLGDASYSWDNSDPSSHNYKDGETAPTATATAADGTKINVKLGKGDVTVNGNSAKAGTYKYNLTSAGAQAIQAQIDAYNQTHDAKNGFDYTFDPANLSGNLTINKATPTISTSDGAMVFDDVTNASAFGATAHAPVVTIDANGVTKTLELNSSQVKFDNDGNQIGTYSFTVNDNGINAINGLINTDSVLGGNVNTVSAKTGDYTGKFNIVDQYKDVTAKLNSGSKYYDGKNASQGTKLTVSLGTDANAPTYTLTDGQYTVSRDSSDTGKYTYSLTNAGKQAVMAAAYREGYTVNNFDTSDANITINATSNVTVHYVDQDGKTVASDTTIQGGVYQSQYTVTAKSINGYDVVGPTSQSGEFSGKPGSVTFTYKSTTTTTKGGSKITKGGTITTPGGSTITKGGSKTTPNGTTTTKGGSKTTKNGTIITPNGSKTTPNGTKVTPGGSKTTPNGSKVTPDGTITTHGGTITTPHGTKTTTNGSKITKGGTITTKGGTKVTPGGKVTPPDHSNTTKGGTVTTPGGSKITRGGTITTKKGSVVTPGGTITTPNGTKTTPNGSRTTPNGTIITKGGTKTTPNGTKTTPNGSKITKGGTITTRNGTKVTPNGTVTPPDNSNKTKGGTITTNGGSKITKGGTITTRGGSVITKGGSTTTPNGTKTTPGGTKTTPNGTKVTPNGTKTTTNGTTTTPDGTKTTTNGTKTTKNGTVITKGGTITTRNGSKVTPGGKITPPDGSKTTNGGTITTTGGSTITKGGTITTRGGSKITKGGSTTTPNGTKTTPGGTKTTPNGTKTTKNGTVITAGGNKTTPNGSKITPGGTITTRNGSKITPGGKITPPNGSHTTSGGTINTPNGSKITTGGTVTTKGGSKITKGGTITTPNGSKNTKNGSKTTPNGTVITKGGSKTTPNGTKVTPNGTKTTPGGTVITRGGSKTTPNGSKVTPNGTKTTPNGTKVTPGGTKTTTNGSTITTGGTIITRGGSKITPGGNVTPPDHSNTTKGGTITTPNGSTITKGGTIKTRGGSKYTKGGSKITPNGTKVTPNGTKTTPGGTVITQGGSKTNGKGTKTTKNGTVITKNGTITTRGGSKITPGGTVTPPDGSHIVTDGSTVTKGGSKITKGGTITTQNGSKITKGGSVTTPNGTKTTKDGTVITRNGSKTTPGGSKVTPNGTKTTPNGTVITRDGSITTPNGTKTTPNGTITTRNGTKITPGGTVTPPNHSTNHNGTWTTPNGSKITKGGTVTTHGGSKITKGGSVTTPNGSKTTKNGSKTTPNGTVITKGGSKTTPNGTKVTPGGTKTTPGGTKVTPGGTVINPDHGGGNNGGGGNNNGGNNNGGTVVVTPATNGGSASSSSTSGSSNTNSGSTSSTSSAPSKPSSNIASNYYTKLSTHVIVTSKGMNRYNGKKFATAKKLSHVKAGTVLDVTNIVRSGNTNRFVLRDGSYVSAAKSFSKFANVGSSYYTNDSSSEWYVTNKKGVYEYTKKTFGKAKKVRHVRQGAILHVKRIVKSGNATRLELTNGRYVTATKSMVKPTKSAKVVSAKGVNEYAKSSLKKNSKVRHYKMGKTLKVKGIVRHNGKSEFKLANGHYVTASKKYVQAEK